MYYPLVPSACDRDRPGHLVHLVAAASSQPIKPCRLDRQSLRQPTGCNRRVHHMVTPEHPTKRRSRKRSVYRHCIRRAGQEARAFRGTTIRRLQDQPSPTRPQPFPRLVEPGDSLTGAACEPKLLADPPDQRCLEHGREIGGHCDRATRGPGESSPQASLGASGF
jgi:hypothetical protein